MQPRQTFWERASVGFFLLFVGVQLVVPAWLLSAPRPSRFGWQMFSGVPFPRQFWVIRENGSVKELDYRPFVGNDRADVDVSGYLPPHLCGLIPDSAAIRYRDARTGELREYRCR